MNNFHYSAIRQLHERWIRLTHQASAFFFVRTGDGRALSPRVVFLTFAGVVALVMALAGAPSSGQRGASDTVHGGLAQATVGSSIERQLSTQVSSAVWGTGVQRSRTVYDAQTNAVTVTITLGGTIPHTDAETTTVQELSKGFCLMAQQAIWTGAARFDQVTVVVQGPLQNEYGEVGTDAYAVSVVRAANGRAIDWTKQTPDSAWQVYDSEFVRTSFVAYV